MRQPFAAFLALVCLPAICAHAQPKPAPQIELAVPAVMTAGKEFPIVYRTVPITSISLDAAFTTQTGNTVNGEGRVLGPKITAQNWVHQGILSRPGQFLLTFRFSSPEGATFTASAPITVHALDQAMAWAGSPWELPRNALYLSHQAAPTWAELPQEKREIIATKRVFFSGLMEQPHQDNVYFPLRAWNEMHGLFQAKYCPPLPLVQAYENPSLYPPKKVAFAMWSQGGANFLYQAEISERAWLLIETPAAAQPPNLAAIFQPSVLAARKGGDVAPTLLARSVTMQRAFAPDTPMAPVHLWLVEIWQGNPATLQMPLPAAPLSPRLAQ